MKVLELMHSLEEAYDRFGDIEIRIDMNYSDTIPNYRCQSPVKELIIESEEFIIKCE